MFTINTTTPEIVLFGHLYAVAEVAVYVNGEDITSSIIGVELYDANGDTVHVCEQGENGVTHEAVMAALALPVALFVEGRTDYAIERSKGL